MAVTNRTSRGFMPCEVYKVLLDENFPVKLRCRLQGACEVYTVREKGWNALENGNLVNAMQADGFDYLITSDKQL